LDPKPRQPQFGDPDYDLAAFYRDVFGGGLRWLATVLAVAGAVLATCLLTDLLPRDMEIPFLHVKGTTAIAVVILVTILWLVIAVVNWRSHLRSRSDCSTAD
jgi:hypothetical protein